MSWLDKERLAKLRQKQESAFTPVFLHRPMAILLLIPIADWKFVTPNGLTTANILMRLVAAFLLWPVQLGGLAPSLALTWTAVILWHLGGALDAADGALARYRGQGSAFGRFYDKVSDRLVTLVMMLAIVSRAFYATDELIYVLLGMAYVAVMSATSVAKWIELGMEAERATAKAADPQEVEAPERSFGDWLIYLGKKFPNLLFVTEMDLPLWGSVAVLLGWEHWLLVYLACTSVPYGLVAIARRARRVWLWDQEKG